MPNNLDENQTDWPQEQSRQSQYGQAVSSRQLDKNQKIAVAVLVFFAILTLVIWVSQTKKTLSPTRQTTNSVNQRKTCSDGNCSGEDEIDLRTKDTDKDGLSDYDELNIYGTSPYLEDSDSDGYSDKQEVDSQNDPNCPLGVDCQAIPQAPKGTDEKNVLNVNNTNKVSNDNLNNTTNNITNNKNNNLENIANQSQTVENVLNGKSDASTLRALLLESGADKNMLDQISDEELMKTYQDTLAK